MLTFNNVQTNHMIEFTTSNSYKYKLAAARYADWSVDCQDAVESITGKKEDLKKLSKDYLALFILYIISFSLSCIVIIARGAAVLTQSTLMYKWMLFARVCLWTLVVPSCFICLIGAKQFGDFFVNVAELGCSDPETNLQFSALGNQFRDKVGYKNNIFTILSLVGMFVEAGMGTFDLCFLPKTNQE